MHAIANTDMRRIHTLKIKRFQLCLSEHGCEFNNALLADIVACFD